MVSIQSREYSEMFRNREEAGRKLAERLRGRKFSDPIVLAIPRGGVVTGAALAAGLDAELDVVLSRKLRAPYQQELAFGAISEDGVVYLVPELRGMSKLTEEYLAEESGRQLTEIARRKSLFRDVRPQAPLAGRSVIVTDDGIATGSTMIAALQTVRAKSPREVIVAAPVASPDRLQVIRRLCDEVVCLLSPEDFWAIGQFYQDFTQVEDEEVVKILREFAPSRVKLEPAAATSRR
jgi:putative phosphoribosyl transferase